MAQLELPVLYKYGSLNEYTESFLRDNVIYFASPLEFNDPFDSRIHYRYDYSTQEFREWVKRGLRMEYPNASVAERAFLLNQVIKDYTTGNREFTERERRAHTKRAADQIGVYCITPIKHSILMMSHYAHSHRGYEVQLNVEEILKDVFEQYGVKQGIQISPVRYQADYPDIDYFSASDKEKAEASLLTKARYWEYEQEWRIIIWAFPSRVHQCKRDVVERLYLGCEISESDENTLINMVKGKKTEVYKLDTDEYTYSLTERRII